MKKAIKIGQIIKNICENIKMHYILAILWVIFLITNFITAIDIKFMICVIIISVISFGIFKLRKMICSKHKYEFKKKDISIKNMYTKQIGINAMVWLIEKIYIIVAFLESKKVKVFFTIIGISMIVVKIPNNVKEAVLDGNYIKAGYQYYKDVVNTLSNIDIINFIGTSNKIGLVYLSVFLILFIYYGISLICEIAILILSIAPFTKYSEIKVANAYVNAFVEKVEEKQKEKIKV